MVSLTALWLPIVLSAVAIFIASSVIHMVFKYHNSEYRQLPDEDGVLAIGSGANFAMAAARALLEHTSMSAKEIVQEAMKIAARICVYTNDHLTVEEL